MFPALCSWQAEGDSAPAAVPQKNDSVNQPSKAHSQSHCGISV